jgi:hypothetical protein
MKFFVMKQENRGGLRALATDASPVSLQTGEAPYCPLCGAAMGWLSWLPPRRVKLRALSGVLTDFVSDGGWDLVSGEVCEGIRNRGIRTAATFPPVEIVSVRPARLMRPDRRYYFLDLPISAAGLDEEKSGLVYKVREPYCNYCGGRIKKSRKCVVLEEGTWQGEDLFIPRKTGDIVVTENFVDMCLEAEFTGARFIPAEEAGFEFP